MANEISQLRADINELRLQLAQGIATLDARLCQQDVSLFLLQKAVAALLNPKNPESSFQRLLALEKGLQRVEEHVLGSHELLEKIRQIQEQS
jgi:hypothetical protein